MNKLLCTLMAAVFCLNSYSAFAADQSTNTQDAQEGLTQDESMSTPTGNAGTGNADSSSSKHNKNMKHKTGRSGNQMDHKMMDTNSDGMISREEYMNHHEMAYSKMKQTNGGVSMKEMNAQMNLGTTKGNKIQPSNTKDVAPVSSY